MLYLDTCVVEILIAVDIHIDILPTSEEGRRSPKNRTAYKSYIFFQRYNSNGRPRDIIDYLSCPPSPIQITC